MNTNTTTIEEKAKARARKEYALTMSEVEGDATAFDTLWPTLWEQYKHLTVPSGSLRSDHAAYISAEILTRVAVLELLGAAFFSDDMVDKIEG